MRSSKLRPILLSVATLSLASPVLAQPRPVDRISDCELSGCFAVDRPPETQEDPESQEEPAPLWLELGITDGMEGCSTVTICNNTRSRASGRAEYQFGVHGLRPWLAFELGRERWSGTDVTTSGFPEVSGVRTVWAGQAGFDGVVGRDDGVIGLGLFATYLGHDGAGGLGAGARLVMAFL